MYISWMFTDYCKFIITTTENTYIKLVAEIYGRNYNLTLRGLYGLQNRWEEKFILHSLTLVHRYIYFFSYNICENDNIKFVINFNNL